MASDYQIEFAERAYDEGRVILETLRTINEEMVKRIEGRRAERASDGSQVYTAQSLDDYEKAGRTDGQRQAMAELEKSAIIPRLDQALGFASRFTDAGRTTWAREARFTM